MSKFTIFVLVTLTVFKFFNKGNYLPPYKVTVNIDSEEVEMKVDTRVVTFFN